jgi:hypothetical protein
VARIDLNSAGRPFVNHRPLVVLTAIVALVGAVATFANGYGLLGSLAESRALRARLAATRAEAAEARAAAAALADRTPDRERKRLRKVAASATVLIEKRRLSWTRLFDQLEAVLPRDVRVLTVTPDVRERQLLLMLDCVAKNNEGKLKLYEKLYEAPFGEAYLMGETVVEDEVRFQVRCVYDPGGVDAEPIWEPMPWQSQTPPWRQAAAGNGGPGDGRGGEPAAGGGR